MPLRDLSKNPVRIGALAPVGLRPRSHVLTKHFRAYVYASWDILNSGPNARLANLSFVSASNVVIGLPKTVPPGGTVTLEIVGRTNNIMPSQTSASVRMESEGAVIATHDFTINKTQQLGAPYVIILADIAPIDRVNLTPGEDVLFRGFNWPNKHKTVDLFVDSLPVGTATTSQGEFLLSITTNGMATGLHQVTTLSGAEPNIQVNDPLYFVIGEGGPLLTSSPDPSINDRILVGSGLRTG